MKCKAIVSTIYAFPWDMSGCPVGLRELGRRLAKSGGFRTNGEAHAMPSHETLVTGRKPSRKSSVF